MAVRQGRINSIYTIVSLYFGCFLQPSSGDAERYIIKLECKN